MNVVISRVPRGRQVVSGRSACPHCDAEIAWYDNIPLVSYLVLGGRCRSCKARISPQYPLVELAVALMWLAVVIIHGLSWTSALLAYLAAVSVALVVIDILHRRLPHGIVLPSYGVVAVLAGVAWIVGERGTWISALIGMAVLSLFYGLLWFFYPKGMGFGDVTTAGLLGFVLGFMGWEQLAVGGIAGPLVGGLMVIGMLIAGRVRKGVAVPYGPALIAGAWVGIFAGQPIAQGYLGLLGSA